MANGLSWTFLIISLLTGLLGGGVAGALAGYFLQRVGSVTCVVSEWRPMYFQEKVSSGRTRTEEEQCEPTKATSLKFGLLLDFFNTKAVDTGIRGLCVAFRSEEGKVIGASPLYENKSAASTSSDGGRVTSVNLPSHGLTSLKLYGSGNETIAQHVAKKGRVEIFGYFPNRAEFTHSVNPARDSWSPIVPMEVREEPPE